MKKLICFCVMMLGLLSLSFAESGVRLQVNQLNIFSEDNNQIVGGFEIENLSDGYSSELFYIISLIDGEQYLNDVNSTLTAIDQLKPSQFSLGVREKKYIDFKYILPNNLPNKKLLLNISFAGKTSEYSEVRSRSIESRGTNTNYLSSADYTNTHFWKEDGYLYPLSGPSFKPGAQPMAYINLKSDSSEKTTVKPYYTVYRRTVPYENKAYMLSDGEEVTFKPGETKIVPVKLPKINEPDSYLVKVEFRDEDYNKASNIYYFRYVIKGENAKILSVLGEYKSESSAISLNVYCSGPADGSSLNAQLVIKAYDETTKEQLMDFADELTIGQGSLMNEIMVPIKNVGKDIKIEIAIKNKDKVLDSRIINIEGKATKEKIEKVLEPNDVQDTKYEDAVEKLILLGIVSGYPDGTFKPGNNITRAELTSIALKMKNIDVSTYETVENAFSDVPTEHWANKTINIANKEGIISGYGNGIFKPDNNVTYAEAITILLNVTGYRAQVLNIVDTLWPDNYIKIANELNVLKDIETTEYSINAVRGDIANITLSTYLVRR